MWQGDIEWRIRNFAQSPFIICFIILSLYDQTKMHLSLQWKQPALSQIVFLQTHTHTHTLNLCGSFTRLDHFLPRNNSDLALQERQLNQIWVLKLKNSILIFHNFGWYKIADPRTSFTTTHPPEISPEMDLYKLIH